MEVRGEEGQRRHCAVPVTPAFCRAWAAAHRSADGTKEEILAKLTARGGIAACAAGLVLLWCGAALAAPLVCARSHPEVTLDLRLPEPVVDNTIAQPALQRLAGVQYHRGRAAGLYTAKLSARSTLDLRHHTVGDEACVILAAVVVHIAMPDRRIYVVRDRRPGTCAYEAVLTHERKHRVADDQVVREHLANFRAQVIAAIDDLRPPRPVPVAEIERERQRLAAAVGSGLDRALRLFEAARHERQVAIDSLDEYQHVASQCH